ncbi:MAG: sortase, partial [Anaerolineales bacterium]
APGAAITCTASYTITQADLDSGSVTNTAAASASFNSNPVVSNEDSETAYATQLPSIQVVKEVSVDGGLSWFDANSPTGPVVGPTSDPRFRFTVENSGNVTLANLSLSDTDIGVFYQSDLSTACVFPGTLAPGATFACFATLAWAPGQHSNTATAGGDFNNTTYSDNDDAHYFGTTAAYTISKTVTDVDGAGPGGSVDAIGDVIAYQVVVTNTGNQVITGVTLSDTLVASVGSPVESLASNGSLDVGETWTWTYTYTVTQADIDSNGGGDGDIDNTATVSSNELSDQSDSRAVGIVQAYSMTILKEVSDDNATWVDNVTVRVGDTVYYRVRVENTGNTTLTGLTVSDPVCSLTRGSDLTGDDDGEFEPGEEWAYYCSITAVAGLQTNTASADSNETPQDSDDASYFGGDPSLNIIKEVSDDNATWVDNVAVSVGDTVYYRVRVENLGNISLSNLVVDDGMPACTLIRGSDLNGDDDGEFEVGEEWAYYCSVTAVVGTQVNTASADSDETPTDTDSASYLGIAAPSISKLFSPGTINAGEVSTLIFTINNPNTSTALIGVAFDDTFPTTPGAMVVASPANASSTCGGTVSAIAGTGSISFNAGTIPPGGSCTVRLDVTAPVAGVYANISGFVSSTNGGVGNRASASLIVGSAAIGDPAVTKSGDPSTAQVGDIVTFTLQVFNNGSVDATNVVVTDTLPNILDYVTISAPGATSASYNAGTRTVTIDYALVTPSDLFSVLLTTRVNDLGTPPGGTNTVNLVSESPDADPTNNVDSTPISIVVPSEAPAPETGFAPDRVSSIPAQPEGFTYERYPGLSVEIPALGVRSAIVGVPLDEDGWDVTWLWDQVGYLDGTAFPGWDGNSVLTGHVYLPSGLPGPFVDLKRVAWGDQVVVESFGSRYIYEVRESRLYAAESRRIIRHEETPWLTLITCQSFDEESGTYKWRRVVRAVLVAVEDLP